MRLAYLDHPTPVHRDEIGFVDAIGFPSQYPVHHPGYPLWVAMGTVSAATGLNGYAAYQLWSVLASLTAPLLFYVALRRSIGDGVAGWLALAFGASPVVWFASTTALNYVPALVPGLLIIGACRRALERERPGRLRAAAVAMSVGILLRPDLLMWLGPMLAWTALRYGWRQRIGALLIVALGVAALGVITSVLYGRADSARPRPELWHTIGVIRDTSVFTLGVRDGFLRSLLKLAANLTWDFGASGVLLVWAILRWRRVHAWRRDASVLLLLWVVPLTAFVLLIHMNEPGHVMLLIPAGFCAMGVGLRACLPARTAARLAAAAAICTLAQFAAYPWSADNHGWKRVLDDKIAYMSGTGLRRIDRWAETHSTGDVWPTPVHRPTSMPSVRHPGGPESREGGRSDGPPL